MKKNEDGSVVLTKNEVKQLNTAYQTLYDLLSDMPSYMGDFMERKDHQAVVKWHCLLKGERYRKKDWFEEEEGDERSTRSYLGR